jgi:ankyrin repeat protein
VLFLLFNAGYHYVDGTLIMCAAAAAAWLRLSAGANALLQDSDGDTPLHKAATEGHAAVAAALLAAAPTAAIAVDRKGLTAQARATGAAIELFKQPR